MHELHAILDTWQDARDGGQPAVLATVVHVRGSAYRRPGARMLLLPDGTRVGSVSGGCLEGDLSKKAWWLTDDGRATVRVYDTTSEEDAVWEFGLGCNGVVEVLLERLDSRSAIECLECLERWRHTRTEGVVATVTRSGGAEAAVGDRLLVDARGEAVGGALRDSPLCEELLDQAASCFLRRKGRLLHLDGHQLFVEWVGPPLSLVVFGAGHDAVPLVAIAAELGWNVTVADSRPGHVRPERFPGAERVLRHAADDPLRGVEIGPDSAVMLMTHNFPQDARLLRELLPLRPSYLGILGPRDRAERLLTEIGEARYPEVLHAPAGLDVGAETPQAIALAIAAEIQATFARREGGMLRERDVPIHAPVEEVRARVPCHV